MMEINDYLFKIASHPEEFEQIHKLNYQTFSEEIPQHEQNSEGVLVDKFHAENTYIICLKNNVLAGMLCVRGKRPFSLDGKIGAVENHLTIQTENICEIRLLAVKKEYRNGRVFLKLAQFMAAYCLEAGYDTAVISGTTRELKLYRQMGFLPFGHLTGTPEASFQPLYLTESSFKKSLAGRLLKDPAAFLPGPVNVTRKVMEALGTRPFSHRSQNFYRKMKQARQQLCRLASAKDVQILFGSGSLANDVIAGQLSLLKGRGLILINGEFGQRLKKHAERMGLPFEILEKDWGQPFGKEEIEAAVTEETEWIWAVHGETSTGMLNSMEMLKQIASLAGLKLCLDCISSIGAVPINLEGVYLASGVSGKAIGGLTGLSFVFHESEPKYSYTIPSYLNLALYHQAESTPFSQSSNLLEALITALEECGEQRMELISSEYAYIRCELEKRGFSVMASRENSFPFILTILMPESVSAEAVGKTLRWNGVILHYESGYLKERNWLQIACNGNGRREEIDRMIAKLHQSIRYEQSLATSIRLLN
ncbi:aminotransferase class V-fold PLP-dependent enzyme [Mesobacillus foraminis]|nr:aminotransferase class V-fold PLP-dependent enzyme [Mesobacillus foraminis]